MKWTVLAAAAALLAQAAVFEIPYDRLDSERPRNVTGLDFYYYANVGSYYNGTFSLRISPLYDPQILGFQEISPKYPEPSPFYLTIEAWDTHYNLTFGRGSSNYSEYQEIHIYTGWEEAGHLPIWIYNMTHMANNNNNDDEPLYRFAGEMNTIDYFQVQEFKFNASGICSDESDVDYLLYGGTLLPNGAIRDVDWADNPIPAPRISGSFNTRVAQVTMSGLFNVGNEKGAKMVGRAEMVFRGEIDEERSDQLLLGRSVPEWNATLGFVRGSVGSAKSGATRAWGLGEVGKLVFGGVVMGFGVAVPLVFF